MKLMQIDIQRRPVVPAQARQSAPDAAAETVKIITDGLTFYYGSFKALEAIDLKLLERQITAIIGPSGCGKSTFLRTLNRMQDLIHGVRIEGKVLLDGEDIYAPDVDVARLRTRVGMVFQRPNPFPKSIF